MKRLAYLVSVVFERGGVFDPSDNGGGGGWKFNVSSDVVFWAVIGVVVLLGVYLLLRRFVEVE